jgi:hypothetical protein
VSAPWIAFFGYRFLDALQRPYQHRASGAFLSLLIVPVGGPILLLVIMWVLAGFRKSEQIASEARTSARNDARPSQPQPHSEGSPNAKFPPRDDTKVGKVLGKIFLNPMFGTK